MDGKSKNKINLVLDMIMTLVMIPIFLVKGEFHESLGYTLGFLVLAHIVLHWAQIKVMFRKNANTTNLILDIILTLTIILIFSVKGDLHESFGYTLGLLVLAHIVLHWAQIKVMYRQLIPDTTVQVVSLAIFILLVASMFLIPGLLPQDDSRPHPQQRHTQRGGPH
jgi:hypothetical protein